MMTVTSKNLLDVLKAYFRALGLGAEAEALLTAKQYAKGLVLKLPAVCLVPANKPGSSRSKQTHIHVTGSNRYFFYPEAVVEGATASSPDYRQPVLVSEQNLRALRKEALLEGGLLFQPSSIMTKIAYRAAQESQVQISKLRQDGASFIALRNSLYENDLLVFLKHRSRDEMLVMGIPRDFYEGKYEFSGDVYSGLESKGSVTVKNALAAVMAGWEESQVVEDEEGIADAVYQELVNDAPAAELRYEAIPYAPPEADGKIVRSTRPVTNPALGKAVIVHRGFRCAGGADHQTFRKKNGEIYLEVHHLIPLEQQGRFSYKLDTGGNLVPLCPYCHRLLHYGRLEEKRTLLQNLYQEQKEALKKSGLEISLEELLSFL